MKKRLISMLLSVLMVVSLFGGMSVSAYADNNVVEHTMAKNETVLKICDSIGINYYTCKDAIMKLNGFTSEAVFRRLSVGQVVKLPASDAAAVQIMKTAATGTTTVTGGTVTSGGTSSGTTANANVAYWLIPYTMQKGETVAGVCNTLGISFASYQDQIKTINNISSWSKVAAGKTLLLPTASKPVAGTSCYAVVAHYVSKGETAYGICQTYGVSYNANTSLLQSLNPKVSLTNVKYGTTLLVPVSTVVTVGSTGSTGTVINPGTSSGSTTNTGTSTTGKTYKLSTGTVKNGKITFTVNGKTATSAAAGSTVTIKASPDSMCGLKSVSLKYADGSAVPKVTDGSFIMPSCDVVVSATFEKGYYMGPISAHGSVTLYNAQNIITTTAAKGAEIKVVVKPNSGYTISRIYIQKNNGTGAIVKDNMKSGDTFTMPDCPVFVRVEYGETATYKFTTEGSGLNGSFKLKVNGGEVTRAAAGATVEVVASPATGYTAKDENIEVTNIAYGTTIPVTNGKFIMPASDVKVKVTFTKGSAEKYAINLQYAAEGSVSASATEAAAGTKITLTATVKPGYEDKYVFDYFKVVGSFGEEKVSSQFTMPSSDVTVTPVFRSCVATVTLTNDAACGTLTVTTDDGKEVKNGDAVKQGVTISAMATPKAGYEAAVKINGQDINTYTVGSADLAVKVEAVYTAIEYDLSVDPNWIGAFDLEIGGQRKTVSADDTFKVTAGTKIKVVLTDAYASGYKITGVGIAGQNTMGITEVTMPADNATIKVLIEKIAPAAPDANSLEPLADLPLEDTLAPLG